VRVPQTVGHAALLFEQFQPLGVEVDPVEIGPVPAA
jgi:hypothetical protein